ncbi:hypothetical protein ALC57_00983 [Trachymyrmex cornetzi]|uniref:Helix-turn-helix domain-containing protein n=1 Tax=Trachymyrmex cornetzi TaxID=471704 RepID=A0A195EN68_9HYME|nr:hypothetical protein ALC57_00983 [Trachymyrmex cornetzi]
MERGDNSLNFLDVTLIRKDDYLMYDWYHKPSFSARYLNYFSCHQRCHKMGIIMSLIDRVLLLSHPTFHEKNFKFIINILLTNGYPLKLIFESIRKRLHTKFRLLKTRVKEHRNHINHHGHSGIEQGCLEEEKEFDLDYAPYRIKKRDSRGPAKIHAIHGVARAYKDQSMCDMALIKGGLMACVVPRENPNRDTHIVVKPKV